MKLMFMTFDTSKLLPSNNVKNTESALYNPFLSNRPENALVQSEPTALTICPSVLENAIDFGLPFTNHEWVVSALIPTWPTFQPALAKSALFGTIICSKSPV